MAIRVWLAPRDVCALMATQSAVRRMKAMMAQSLQVSTDSPELIFAMASFSKFYSRFYNSCISTQNPEVLDRHRLVKVPRMAYLILKSLGFCVFQTENGEAPMMGPGGYPLCVWNPFRKKTSDEPALVEPQKESLFQVRRKFANLRDTVANTTNKGFAKMNEKGATAHAAVHSGISSFKARRSGMVQNAANYHSIPKFDAEAVKLDISTKFPLRGPEWEIEEFNKRKKGYEQREKISLSALNAARAKNMASQSNQFFEKSKNKTEHATSHATNVTTHEKKQDILNGSKKCTNAAQTLRSDIQHAETIRCDNLKKQAEIDLKSNHYTIWDDYDDAGVNPHPYVKNDEYHESEVTKKTHSTEPRTNIASPHT